MSWKIVAIIFIIIAIAEALLIGWAWSYGNEMIENDNTCAYDICEDYPSYYYDEYEKMCYCYEDNEITKVLQID